MTKEIVLPEPAALQHPDPWPSDMPMVMTPKLRRVIDAVGRAVKEAGVVAVSGLSGTGKTSAAHAGAVLADIPWLRFEVPADPSPKSLTLGFWTALQGKDKVDWTAHRHEVEHDIRADFVAHRRLFVVDEGERLGRRGADAVRYWRAVEGNQTSMVLVGHKLTAFLNDNDAVRTRLVDWVEFTPLQGDKRLATVAALHPILQEADRALLERIDREWARGLLRLWARVVRTALEIEPGATVVTPQLWTVTRGGLGRR